jgi:phage terminase small subunit
MRELTPKQRAFVAEYLIDLNATQAALRSGYSPKTAHVIGHENLKKPEIAAAIAEAMAAREKRTHITQDRVLQELARLAFSDIRKAFNADGTLKAPQELDDDIAAALAGIDTTTERTRGGEDDPASLSTKKIKVFDKGAALTLAMKHLGMLTEKVEATVTNKTLPSSVDEFV